MARKATCPHCNQFIEIDDGFKKFQNRKYHLICYKLAMEEIYENNKKDIDPKQELYEYICKVYGTQEVSPMINSQIERYMTEYPTWKYSGILYTIRYLTEVEKTDIKNNPNIRGVGFLPYKYDLAKQHFLIVKSANDNLNEQLKNKTIKDFVIDKKIRLKPINYDNNDKDIIKIEDL